MTAPSPLDNAEGPLRLRVSSEGTDVAETVQLVSATVRSAINCVPSATLVFSDGDLSEQGFPLSDKDTFAPGKRIVLRAGWGDSDSEVFSGTVVRHGLRIGGDSHALLVVECRDAVVRMTVGRRNATYINQSDADVMQALIETHGLKAVVSDATLRHKELVQHYCTDWDFLLLRAQAIGCIVLVKNGRVTVQAPVVGGPAVLEVTCGLSLMQFEADVDVHHQYAKVQAQAWNVASQSVLASAEAPPATLNQQGNLSAAMLAKVMGLDVLRLQTGVPLEQPALDAWAKAQQLKSGLSRLSGHMRFCGSAMAAVGKLIELKGVGERFNGTVFVTALTHQIDNGAWTTDVEFGQPVHGSSGRADILAPLAAGLGPGIEGLHVGKVVKLDGDPEGQRRIQVAVPAVGIDAVWARLMQFHASDTFGALFVPEVGDEVVLGWFDNDPGHPVVLGSLYSSGRVPATTLTAENNVKSIVTRCKSKIEFDEERKVITVSTPGANTIVLSDHGQSILVADQNGNTLTLTPGGITMDSPTDIRMAARGAISIEAAGALTLRSTADVKIEGLNVNATAQVGLTAKGSASAELSASGQTMVKGALVMIN
jgi:Rhs element Vgr protein